jgi:protein-disulfide isomerase
MPKTVSVLLALALAACGPKATEARAPAAGARPDAQVLATLDGAPIAEGEFGKDVKEKLADLDNESRQRRLHLLWIGVEDAMGKRLLAKEAQKRGIAVEVLREQEILSKVTPPTDEEIQQYYDRNADQIGVDYRTAAPLLKQQLSQERALTLERAFVDKLREQSQVKYTFPVPELPRQRLDIGNGPSWGKKDARVTLVEFSDFQCPFCSRASVAVKKLKELYPNDLRIEFRDYPLSQHAQARGAAEAGHCAEEQGKFWEYHDLLFQNARALDQADLQRYAVQAGLDVKTFNSCLESDRARGAVETSISLGQKAGVQGTPALYINGVKLIGLLPIPLLQAFIDHELTRQ